MGGDLAPRAPIAGALLALAELEPQHTILLVGRADAITTTLDELIGGEPRLAAVRERVEVVDAPDLIEMSAKPTAAIRAKPNS